MKRFDYSFLRGPIADSDMLGRILKIQEMEIRMEENRKQNPSLFSGLESVAKIQSVKGSNAIEGIITSDERMAAIVNRNVSPKNHDEMEIAGYRDALDIIHNDYENLKVDETTILRLHEIMMSYLPEISQGYKKEDNAILEIDGYGMRRIRFRPTSADDTPDAMEQMILAYNSAKNEGINPIFLIPCFILDFLCIHPFPDGNGRMSRLLSLLMMYREGLDVGKYISFEEQINRSKNLYYDALQRSSEKWHENDSDYIPFIDNFIGMLYLCYKELDRRSIVVGDNRLNKKGRVGAAVLNSILPISKKEILELLPDISQTTVELELSRLLKDGKIKKIGGNRNARYLRE